MKKTLQHQLHALLIFCAFIMPVNAATPPRWVCSTSGEPWKEMPAAAMATASTASTASNAAWKLEPQTTYQVIDGFGACFNDLGWQALLALDEPKRDAALKELFDPSGANFTLGRASMGANDFSLKYYSLNDTPGDYAMKNFSIERDRQDLIPFIKAAMKYQPKLGVWGVPWTPPAWMKTNGHYKGGELKQDSDTLSAYALYFSKYVQAYRAEGINLYAVMPQNEPNYNNNIYPQCRWTGAQLNLFLRDYLAPRLKQDNVDVEVWLGTIANEKMEDYTTPALDDAVTNPLITGVGYQYGGQKLMEATYKRYPDKKLTQTETECFDGKNSWKNAMDTFCKLIQDTNHYANSYFFWNMILNESARSTWNWSQD